MDFNITPLKPQVSKTANSNCPSIRAVNLPFCKLTISPCGRNCQHEETKISKSRQEIKRLVSETRQKRRTNDAQPVQYVSLAGVVFYHGYNIEDLPATSSPRLPPVRLRPSHVLTTDTSDRTADTGKGTSPITGTIGTRIRKTVKATARVSYKSMYTNSVDELSAKDDTPKTLGTSKAYTVIIPSHNDDCDACHTSLGSDR